MTSPVSIARHHAEWLSLVETSGPFLTMPVLLRAFPQGLERVEDESERLRNLRLAYDEWEESHEGRRPDPAIHNAWVRFVLTEVLELPGDMLLDGQSIPTVLLVPVVEHGELLAPDLAVANRDDGADAGKTRLLVHVYPAGQELGRAVPGRRWTASPESRMVELLRGVGVRLGLVTNGEHWLLISAAPGEPAGFASWYASLWFEEPLTLRAFRDLLGARRFFSVAETDTLEALLAESASAQQEVTDQLGYQVRRAVEVLVQSLDRADRDHGGALLRNIAEARLYEAAVTVMMRLVFLFAAEERGLFPLDDPLFEQHYAVSTLRARLRATADQHGEEVLEQRVDAWHRLLATFRAVHGGISHDRLTLPPLGGSLFDSDRFTFLEGRPSGSSWRDTPATPLPVNNRTVLHLLEALQVLQVRVPGGGPAEARRLSFRGLDIEQIGHVYEGLLDHTAVRAGGTVIGLVGSRDGEAEVPLVDLEQLRGQSEEKLVEFLEEETGRSASAITSALRYEPTGEDLQGLLVALDNDPAMEQRLRPFAKLVRRDTYGRPLVMREGGLYVTRGSDRRSTGTHYTQRSLTEPLVQHALEPLVYNGPADGKPRGEWRLRPAREILALKVCDMAMGSGAFLVQTCRYLSACLVEAWAEAERQHPGAPGITPEGAVSTGSAGEHLIPKETEERLALARRLIVDRCLYGVDRNPMAVEMAKLSLWLITLQKDRPFTFLDHALKCGDSLLGVWSSEQIEHFDPDPGSGRQLPLWSSVCTPALRSALEKRQRLASFTVEEIRDAEEKARLHAEATQALRVVRVIGDLLAGATLATAGKRADALDDLLEELLAEIQRGVTGGGSGGDFVITLDMPVLEERARRLLGGGKSAPRVPFHWPLEFPEVFAAAPGSRRGFDAIVGNPPFLGGQKITGVLGTDYRNYLVTHLAGGQRGSADLCAYFFLRARQLLREGGGLGMLATNTIAQGDTREVGLEQIVSTGGVIYRAVPSRKWPGTSANLEVAHVWVRRGQWNGEYVLDDRGVPGITPFLTVPGAVTGKPYRLAANADKSFIGSYVLGMGFVLTPEEAQALIARNPRNRDVLFPYLNGEDLNSRPDQSPSRWVINFKDRPLRRGAPGRWRDESKEQRKEWLRSGIVPDDYPDSVAADYTECLRIVEEKVKPERERNKRKVRRERWWQFAERAPDLYATIAGMDQVFVTARVSKFLNFAAVRVGIVASEATVVIADPRFSTFAVVQSSLHEAWVREYQSSLETRGRYTPSDCVETFTFPASNRPLESVGEEYHQARAGKMRTLSEGVTTLYNRFHDTNERGTDIARLRELHVEMDRQVANAYGWTDLDPGHDFHQTKQGVRFTISERARQEVLARLLRLNHERYQDEVRRGLHDRKKVRRRADEDDDDRDNLFDV